MDAAGALARYRAVLETTRQMLAAARAQDWDALIALEAARKPEIGLLTTLGIDYGASSAEKDACIREILALDEEIAGLTRSWLAEITEILGAIHTRRRLARAYQGG
jgi:ABC-type branched-subunit amino acid transport system ATPase component